MPEILMLHRTSDYLLMTVTNMLLSGDFVLHLQYSLQNFSTFGIMSHSNSANNFTLIVTQFFPDITKTFKWICTIPVIDCLSSTRNYLILFVGRYY